jgi:hypothetical protein
MTKKVLVFHFYVYDKDGYFDNLAYRMHIQCLTRYASVFDKACINLSCDNPNDVEKINKVKHTLIDCGFKDIEIIVTQNDCYCEVNTFKHFVLDKLGTTNDLVFFGHTKGMMNVIDGVNNPESILHWIYTMYFFNLEPEYVDNMQKHIVYSYGGNQDTFFGTLRKFIDDGETSIYCGTFYWINVMKLYEDNIAKRIRIPNIYNRNFCEELPCVYRDDYNAFNGMGSYYNMWIIEDAYDNPDWNSMAHHLSMGDNTKYVETYDLLRSLI